MVEETHYDRLGLSRDASSEDIRHAYRELAQRLHPDKNERLGDTELFLGVQRAYDILSDPRKKATYDRRLPDEFTPLSIRVLNSREALVEMSESQLLYVLVELTSSADAKVNSSPPVNISLVLDRSTSIKGVMLDTVKATAIQLVQQMRPKDYISIIGFSDRAEILVPAGSHQDSKAIETTIRMMQTSGGTEIFRGLEAGFAEVRNYCSNKHINHIILLTDGRTYGDEPECLELAEEATTLGVGISALGIGEKWNDEFLDELTTQTGGNSTYVTKPREVRRFLNEKIAGLSDSYADQITYKYETSPEIVLNYAFRIQPETSPLATGPPMILGSLPRGTSMSVLLEFIVNDVPSGVGRITLSKGRVSGNIPSYLEEPQFNQRLDLHLFSSQEPDEEPPPQEIVQAMSRLTLYRMQERARQDVAAGNIQEATRRLQNLATHLLAQEERELARTVIGEIAHLHQTQTFSAIGEKSIKYGTRALLLVPGEKE